MLSALSLASCGDDNFGPDPSKDWQGTTELFQSAEEQSYQTYYKPALGTVGDPMPFYDQKAGDFKVMYLQEFPNNLPLRFHPYWAVSTKDCVNYQSLGEWLSIGSFDEQQDAVLGTGCCYYNEKDGLYYIYYTGESGKTVDRQVVMRATSADLKNWTRDNSWSLKGKDYGYSGFDFRDPQIFKIGNEYHMIVSTKPITGGDPCFAEFKSADLKKWEHVEKIKMIWDRMLECPDVFEMNGKWYLVYSEAFAAEWSRKVKYMMADSWADLKNCFNDGPKWPADDKEGVLDSRAFYAGKTASNGTDRYIWGWCPERPNQDNTNVGNGRDGQGNEPSWSGALVCHKLIQHEDGTLTIGEVPAMAEKYNKTAEVKVMEQKANDYTLYSRLGNHNHISFTIQMKDVADRFGVSFVRSTDVKKYYTMVVNPEWENGRRKVNFEQEGAEGMGFIPGADGYIFPTPADNKYKVDIYTDNSVVTMYINGVYGCTQRIYGINKNCWSINTYGAAATVSDVQVSQY